MPSEITFSSSLDHWFSTDAQLHHVYPKAIQLLARRHWTPISVTRMVAQFLAPEAGAKVLDIGSGVGKFCLAGAFYRPSAFFYGVEQRKHLVAFAESASTILGMKNVSFIHRNFTQLDLKEYDHFYFYNSFHETFQVQIK